MEPDSQEEVKTFKSLGICEQLVEACENLGWKNPSKIQAEIIPHALEGKDLIGVAQTGSGKTGAFALPILQALLRAPQAFFACVLSPTRELAIQIAEQFEALGSGIGIKCAVLVGEVGMEQQAINLAKEPHIVIGTPGCLVDHLSNTEGFPFQTLKYFVLDEADRLLNEDFEKSIDAILNEIPCEKTYLFSATMTKKIRKLQRARLRNSVKIEVATKFSTIATSSGQENSLVEASKTLAEATINHHLETSENFFNNLSSKIQQGLESKVVDLGALAERLVSSAIYWLIQKHEVQGTLDDQPNARKSDSSLSCIVATELIKLLLREPKDLAAKLKINVPFQGGSPGSTGQTSDSIVKEHELQIFQTSDSIVKEHELQIFFRMEILRSPIRVNISESMKQKFVKHICLLLETIQCHLEEGFFGEWSFENYVGKIIKARYCPSLGDVVNKVYEKMDLLLFVDENKSTNHPLLSEDSNHPRRDNSVSDGVGDNYSSNDPVLGENKLHGNDNEKSPGIKNDYTCKLLQAQERRERARRFSSFTSWVPDLHRVWAPKQLKARRKPKTNHLQKASKRKYQSRESNEMVVCETPEKRHSSQRANQGGDEDAVVNNGNQLCRSVSKALFKDMDS